MSTDNIQECLYYLRGIDFDREVLTKAREELAALRRAARTLDRMRVPDDLRGNGAGDVATLIEAIAKGAP